MPLLRQKWIFRSDLQNNPHVLYLFGDNHQRVGLGGQAKEMRGEPNAVGIRTKWAPGNEPEDFFGTSPGEYTSQVKMIDDDFVEVIRHLGDGGLVVLPTDGLGTGLSNLPEVAPDTAHYLENIYSVLKGY